MAKLNKKTADAVEKAESGFKPMDEGIYHFILKDVDATREGKKGPYWSWEFECIEEPYKGRRQWNNTSLSQEWSFKQTFEAFGTTPDTDTDDLIGKPVRLVLSIRTIQEGTRKGELTNQVDRVRPADEEADCVKEHLEAAGARARVDEIF
jgi:hypothetical protein